MKKIIKKIEKLMNPTLDAEEYCIFLNASSKDRISEIYSIFDDTGICDINVSSFSSDIIINAREVTKNYIIDEICIDKNNTYYTTDNKYIITIKECSHNQFDEYVKKDPDKYMYAYEFIKKYSPKTFEEIVNERYSHYKLTKNQELFAEFKVLRKNTSKHSSRYVFLNKLKDVLKINNKIDIFNKKVNDMVYDNTYHKLLKKKIEDVKNIEPFIDMDIYDTWTNSDLVDINLNLLMDYCSLHLYDDLDDYIISYEAGGLFYLSDISNKLYEFDSLIKEKPFVNNVQKTENLILEANQLSSCWSITKESIYYDFDNYLSVEEVCSKLDRQLYEVSKRIDDILKLHYITMSSIIDNMIYKYDNK